MIIDADSHLSPFTDDPICIKVEEMLKRMERSRVDKALTWLHPQYNREVEQSNEYVFKAMKQNPGKIYGFGWVDPNLGVNKAKDLLKKCLYDYGFFGIKLNGAVNGYFIDDPIKSMPLIEEVAKAKKILAFHVGANAYEFTHPFRVAKIAKQYPELQILMIHMGGAGLPDLSKAAIEMASEYSNISLVGSEISEESVLVAIKTLGAHRVCFGSDTPFKMMHVSVAKYQVLLEGEVTEEEKNQIMGGNIARLIGLNK